MTETPQTTAPERSAPQAALDDVVTAHGTVQQTRTWLEAEFPGWDVDVDETATWEGDMRPLWIARRDGHHPQAELSAAKLHTRLTDYLDRVERRHSFGN